MVAETAAPRESQRLDALIRQCVGWQVDEVHALVSDSGIVLCGHACSNLARMLAETEAARLSGLPVVENRIEVG
jgi:hypothetical protein